jgi:hypothetical protein
VCAGYKAAAVLAVVSACGATFTTLQPAELLYTQLYAQLLHSLAFWHGWFFGCVGCRVQLLMLFCNVTVPA